MRRRSFFSSVSSRSGLFARRHLGHVRTLRQRFSRSAFRRRAASMRAALSAARAHPFPRLLAGDWLTLLASLLLVLLLFQTLWQSQGASKLRIRQGDTVYATLSLDQKRTLHLHGPQGETEIVIDHGRVRFLRAPCNSQYCVHQGWLTRAGQVAICLPNQISLELLGKRKSYDSLNY